MLVSETAIELGLVDELRMFRNPILVGGGTPFLPPVTEDVLLDLIETRTFGSRVIYERYGRARDESGCDCRPSRQRLARPGVRGADRPPARLPGHSGIALPDARAAKPVLSESDAKIGV